MNYVWFSEKPHWGSCIDYLSRGSYYDAIELYNDMQIGFDSIVMVIKVFIDTLNSPSVPSCNDSWSHRIMLDAIELFTNIPMRYDSLETVSSNTFMNLQ